MPDFSKISINSTVYDVKDASARTSLATVNNQIADLNKRTRRNIVLLGDSWNDIEQEDGASKWPAVLQRVLPELQIHNYAKGGSTILGDDNYALNGTVGGQIAAAIADTSYDHSRIDTIIIFAGVNDFRNSTLSNSFAYTLADNIKTKINERLTAQFPNADYVYVINNSVPASHSQYMLGKKVCDFVNLLTGCRAYSTIGWVNPAYYKDDHIHPDAYGHLCILANMKAILFGGGITYTWPNVVTIPVTGSGISANVTLLQTVTENDIITQVTWNSAQKIANAITMTGDLTSSQLYNLVYFPAWFTPCSQVSIDQTFAMSTVKTSYITNPTLSGTKNEVVDGRITVCTQPITTGVSLGYSAANNTW